jgi:predicted LPLAT superfamily acyltransferase
MGKSWQHQRERGSSSMLHLIRWIAMHLGRGPARLLLYPITLYFLLTGATQRRASREFLSLALDRPVTLLDQARHFHTFASTILDRVFMLTNRYDCFDLKVFNHSLIAEQLEKKQGCVLIGSHLGSFEALRITAVVKRELPVKILMYPEHNQMLVRILTELNPAIQQSIIPLGQPETLIRAKACIEQGEIVGLLGDRIADSGKTISCQFMGRPTQFSQGPILLASLMKVPVFLFFGLYLGGNRYEIHIESLAEEIPLQRGQRERGIQEWTQRYADRLEHYARLAPYNWFNFYDYWGNQPEAADEAPQPRPL